MSIRLMSTVWEIPTDTPAEKLVLLALADRADDEGHNVRPSKTGLATKCCLDRRTVQRVMERLEERQVLVLVAQRVGFPTVYRLDVSRLYDLALETKNKGVAESRTPPAVQGGTSVGAAPRHSGTSVEGGDLHLAPTPCGVTPHNPSDNHELQPSEGREGSARDDDAGDLAGATAVVVPSFAADWPVLHVANGDYMIREPYAGDLRLREGIIEWITWRLADKKKGMPTVYAMTHANCGWWDKYPLDAVVHAVQHAASRKWQGLIEDIAKDWKPSPGDASSVTSSVQQKVQHAANNMEMRQRMIRQAGQQRAAAVAPDGVQSLPQGG